MKKISILLIVLKYFICNGCSVTEINSQWLKNDIVLDGNEHSWGNSLVVLDDINASIGVVNDSDNLFICLTTDDFAIESKVIRGGLTLWFQSNNSDKIGIHFPIGIRDTAIPALDGNMKPEDKNFSPIKPEELILTGQTVAEIISSSGERAKIPISELKDIQIKMSVNNGKLVYELKIPLNKKNDTEYGLNAKPGSILKIGFESGTIDFRNMDMMPPPDGGFDMPPGGDNGPGGAPGGGGFPPPGVMGRETRSLQPIDFEINVKLATEE